ncbi:MAG: penicillin-binding protein 2 [Candidatus Pacebacteria bacterium]|nr:penicillin-binding protein 2 [Candidatus Paceibacterota bacterium]
MRKTLVMRLWIMTGTFVFITVLLIVRLYSLQIVHGDTYKLEASHQYVNTKVGIFDRGNIFMVHRDGSKIASATVRTRFILAIDPRHIDDKRGVYIAINDIIPIDKEDYNKKVAKTDDPYEVLVKDIDEELAKRVRQLNLSGVILTQERKRYYPGAAMSSHILGFVGFDENNNRVGRYGLERYYEDVLMRDSSNLYVNFFAELFTNINEVTKGGSKEGDIELTIDPDIQVFIEKEMLKTQEAWSSKMTAAIVMDPQTGEILAMVVTPKFNLNNFNNISGVSFSNPLISGVYEMGSIIKVLTMAVGLDTGVIRKSTTYNDTGSLTLNGATIHNYDGKSRGVVPMQEVLSQSLNTGVAFIANKVGHEKMREYFIDKLSLGEETGIDLPAEAVGMVKNLESEREIEFATASFGQGVALTPIATLRALAAVANGGYMVQPHMVKRIEYSMGLDKVFDYSDQKERVFKQETTDAIAQMLTKVVDEVLANGKHKMEHYSVGVKTGTAQLATTGGYRDDAYLHTFIGYGPSYDSEFIVLLMNLEPVGARYASETLTEPFVNISKFLINHLDIAPDR